MKNEVIIIDEYASECRQKIVDIYNHMDEGIERDQAILPIWEDMERALDPINKSQIDSIPYIFGKLILRPKKSNIILDSIRS